MIINQRITHQRAALSRVFRCVGCLLLMIFIGRVVLVSVYGYAGVPKFSINSASGSAEQQDDDKKDESKYTEKQFKYIDQDVYSLPVMVSVFLSKPYFCFQADFTISHALAVLTPPPNR